MAKLKSRGRTELARVSREKDTPGGELTIWEKSTVALMSDRNVLEKRDVRFKEGDRHSHGWKVKGKLKEGLTPQQFADIYVKRGYTIESVSTFGTLAKYKKPTPKAPPKPKLPYIGRPLQTVPLEPGFYVTNTTMTNKRAAEHGPFATLDEALPIAWARLQEFTQAGFDYLLPVQIIESRSREDAERSVGYVWWTDGKRKAAPVPAEQLGFNMAGRKRR
jgi:hypothetical protein